MTFETFQSVLERYRLGSFLSISLPQQEDGSEWRLRLILQQIPLSGPELTIVLRLLRNRLCHVGSRLRPGVQIWGHLNVCGGGGSLKSHMRAGHQLLVFFCVYRLCPAWQIRDSTGYCQVADLSTERTCSFSESKGTSRVGQKQRVTLVLTWCWPEATMTSLVPESQALAQGRGWWHCAFL